MRERSQSIYPAAAQKAANTEFLIGGFCVGNWQPEQLH